MRGSLHASLPISRRSALRLMLTAAPVFLSLLALVCPQQVWARAVAVVYDDSGSMKKDHRWWYASYSIQALAGVLAENDTLDVVYMSDPTEARRIQDRQAAIVDFQKRQPADKTPYGAVRTAMDSLSAASDPDRWLVVITDGKFEEGETPLDLRKLPDEARSFVQRTGARTIFLLIGAGADEEVPDLWRREVSAVIFRAEDSNAIVGRMADIAAMVTSRTAGRSALETRLSGTGAEISTALPLRRLIVLQQARKAEALASFDEGHSGDLSIARALEFQVRTPVQTAAAATRFGRITHLVGREADRVIPAGRMMLSFGSPIGADDVAFLPEVAARFEVTLITESGAPLEPGPDGLFEPCIGKPLAIRGRLLGPDGTPLAVDTSGLEVFWQRSDEADRHPMSADASHQQFTDTVVFDSQRMVLSAGAIFPGYFDFKSRIFTVRGQECRPPEFALLVQPADANGSPSPDWSANILDMGGAGSVQVQLTKDGISMTADELDDWTITARAADLDFELRRDDRGWTIVPRCSGFFAACRCPVGTLPVEISASSGEFSTQAASTLVIDDASWWAKCGHLVLWLIGGLLLLVYLLGISPWKKRRFARGAEIQYRRSGSQPRRSSVPLKGSVWNRWLKPYSPERALVEDLWFEAGTHANHVLLPRDQQTDRMSVAGQPIVDPGAKDLRIESGRGHELALQSAGNTVSLYIYQAPSS